MNVDISSYKHSRRPLCSRIYPLSGVKGSVMVARATKACLYKTIFSLVSANVLRISSAASSVGDESRGCIRRRSYGVVNSRGGHRKHRALSFAGESRRATNAFLTTSRSQSISDGRHCVAIPSGTISHSPASLTRALVHLACSDTAAPRCALEISPSLTIKARLRRKHSAAARILNIQSTINAYSAPK